MWQQFTGWVQSRFKTDITPESLINIWPVDIHNHLIPGLDDGVITLENSIICLKQFSDWGIRRVICTPHVSQDYYPNTVAQLQAGADLVKQAIAEVQLPIDFIVAAEYLLDEQFDSFLQKNELLSFGKARYVLVETGWASAPRQLDQWLFSMQLKGYTPVLAHPERYRYYQQKPEYLRQLQEQGCLLQLNLMSLVGRYGREAKQLADNLLHQNCINFIGSDLHRPSDLNVLQKVFTTATLNLLRQQPLLNKQLLPD